GSACFSCYHVVLVGRIFGTTFTTSKKGRWPMVQRFRPSNTLRVVVLSFSLLTMGRLAMSQLPTATILGGVKDSSGAVIPGASITAKNVETGLTRTGVSAEDGSYRLSALPVGGYEVRVELPGFRTEVRSGLTLTVSQEAVVNFTLQAGAVDQTVVVTEDAPLVNTTSGALGEIGRASCRERVEGAVE